MTTKTIVVVALGAFVAGAATATWLARQTDSHDSVVAMATASISTSAHQTGTVERPESRSPAGPAIQAIDASPSTAALTSNLEAALQLDVPSARRRALRTAFRELAQVDGFEALRRANALANAAERHAAVNTVISEFGDLDPMAAFSLAQNYTGSLRAELLRTAVHALAVDDPLSALQTCRSLSDPSSVCQPAVYEQWASQDPEAAIAHALALPGRLASNAAMSAAFSTWAHVDPESARDWLATDAARSVPREGRFRLAVSVVQEDPDAFDAVVYSLPRDSRESLQAYRIQALAQRDVARALIETERLAGTRQFGAAATTLAQSWSRTDPVGAAEWAAALDGGMRTQVLGQIVDQWARQDFDAAIAYVDTLSPDERATMAASLARGLASNDPARAFDWVIGQPDGLLDRSSISSVARRWAAADPASAMNAFLPNKNESWARSGVSAALSQIAQDDPNAAGRWITRLRGSNLEEAAVRSAASVIARDGIDQAIAWSRTLSGRARDLAVADIVSGAGVSTDRVFNLANGLDDTELRQRAVESVLFQMIIDNPTRAAAMIDQAQIDESAREALRQQLPKP